MMDAQAVNVSSRADLRDLVQAALFGALLISCAPPQTDTPDTFFISPLSHQLESADCIDAPVVTASQVGDLPSLHASGDTVGVFLWSETAPGPDQLIERCDVTTGRWETFAAGDGRTTSWFDATPLSVEHYRVWDEAEGEAGGSVPIEPADLEIIADATSSLRYQGETVQISGEYTGDPDAPLDFVISRWMEDGDTEYLAGDCADDALCWTDELATYAPISESLDLEIVVDQAVHGEVTYRVQAGSIEDSEIREMAVDEFSFVAIAREVKWGDLHAHSNLSHDGCEIVDENCADRGDYPGEYFFDTAIAFGLDFAAITDHAEWTRLYPSGDTSGPEIDIWKAQNNLVDEAETEGFVAVLGYEWTWKNLLTYDENGNFTGGHKTVLFEDTQLCAAWRVGVPKSYEESTKGDNGAVAVTGNPYTAGSFTELWHRFVKAHDECGPSRALSFSHHSAYDAPQATDWTNPENEPNPDYDFLIEMYSEHGSSECWDTEAAYCDFSLKSDVQYIPNGSVQAALYQGYELGFVAGTDSHDARPGSTGDASCVAHFADTDGDGSHDTAPCHDYGGGLTAALVDGDFTRGTLFEAFRDRSTMTSTGLTIPIRVLGQSAEGNYFLPGASVPLDEGMFTVLVSTEGLMAANGLVLDGIDIVSSAGEIVATSTSARLEEEIDLADDSAYYVRVRYSSDGNSHRLWASPWFGR